MRNRHQAMVFLENAKKTFSNARHYCWAYLIGNSHAAMNDDGEPSGTTGKPILHVIQHKNIGDVMAIVIRYFGGIKLGAGGLTRAYCSAAEAVLSIVLLEEKVAMTKIVLKCGFSQEQFVRHWFSQKQATIYRLEYNHQVKVDVELADSEVAEFKLFCKANNIRTLG